MDIYWLIIWEKKHKDHHHIYLIYEEEATEQGYEVFSH